MKVKYECPACGWVGDTPEKIKRTIYTGYCSMCPNCGLYKPNKIYESKTEEHYGKDARAACSGN